MRCGVGVIGMGRYGEVWEMRCRCHGYGRDMGRCGR